MRCHQGLQQLPHNLCQSSNPLGVASLNFQERKCDRMFYLPSKQKDRLSYHHLGQPMPCLNLCVPMQLHCKMAYRLVFAQLLIPVSHGSANLTKRLLHQGIRYLHAQIAVLQLWLQLQIQGISLHPYQGFQKADQPTSVGYLLCFGILPLSQKRL